MSEPMLIAPRKALTDPRLTDPERRVLLSLYSFKSGDSDTVWPSLQAIAERCHITDVTRISKLTNRLSEKGWLTKKRRGFTGGNEYLLAIPNLVCDTKLDSDTKLDHNTNTNLDSDTKSNLDSAAKYKEESIEESNEEYPPYSPPPNFHDDAFATFWSAYPRKTDKQKSEKSFRKHVTNQDTLDAILTNIGLRLRAGDWRLDQKTYIPHPTTYLNNHRWNDEVITHEKPRSNSVQYDNSAAGRVRANYEAWERSQQPREVSAKTLGGDG